MTGMDLFDALVAERPELSRRILFITGGAFTAHAEAFLAAHSEIAVIDKPIDAAALCALVDKRIFQGVR
jgi:hypothetical protein